MDKHNFRVADRTPTAGREPQAKIDIVEIDRKIHLIKAANRVKLPSRNHQASAGDRRNFMRRQIPAQPSRRRLVQPRPKMTCDSAHAEENADMLDLAVRVQQFRADRANVGLGREIQKPLDPVGRDDLRIIVEEQQIVARASGGAGVAESRKVELAGGI